MKKKLLALVTVFCLTAVLMTACGGNKDLEAYFNQNKAAIESEFNSESVAAAMGEGVEASVTASGNELIFTVIIPDDLLETYTTDILQMSLDAAMPSMQPILDQLKAEAKIDSAKFTMEYVDSADTVLASESVESN